MNDIAEIYSEGMNFKFFHRLLFFITNVALGFWFLSLFLFKGKPPDWVSYIVAPPVVLWVSIALPKHFAVISEDQRLQEIYFNPFLSLKCALIAIKPKEKDSNKYPWMLALYYFSLFTPIACFLILILFFVLPSIFQNAN